MTITELKKIIKDCGIVGTGGAGFPTHLKIDKRCKTILLNCAECEPLLKVDRMLLTEFTDEILSALARVSEVLNADVIIAVKKTYADALAAVEGKLRPRMKLAALEAVYPAGDEVLLIHEALGVVLPPGTFPIDSGFTVFNVETMYNIYNALEHGLPVTEKWVTIAGEVENPLTAAIPVGTPFGEAVKRAGRITAENPVFIIGGIMMGSAASPSDKIKKTTKAIIVLPGGHIMARRAKGSRSVDLNRAASACCQCRTCTEMCPRYLLGYPIEPNRIMRALCARESASDAFKGTMYCSLCGVCEVACPQSLAPRTLIKTFKNALAEAGVKPEKRTASPVSPMLEGRKITANRLKTRLGLTKYEGAI